MDSVQTKMRPLEAAGQAQVNEIKKGKKGKVQ